MCWRLYYVRNTPVNMYLLISWNIHTLCIHHFKKKRSVADASLTQVWRSTLFSTIRPLRLGPAPRLEVVALQAGLELLEIVEDSNFNR